MSKRLNFAKVKELLDKIKASDKKHLLYALIFSAVIFLLYACYWNSPIFPSDEAEIFMHGQSIANGKLLYKDIASQHTPVMYYLAALFSILGADSVLSFRIFFYAFFAIIYGVIFFRYGKHLSKKGLVLFPIIYILALEAIEFGPCILSDQAQGIGMAILFLEFILFTRTHELPISSCIAISFAIFLSFGSAFVSAFAIFVMFITVLAFDLSAIGKHRPECNATAKLMLFKYLRLVGIVLIPFAILILYLAVTGSLVDAFKWVYHINVTVYPKYIGYSMSIKENIFNGFSRVLIYFKTMNWSLIGTATLLRILMIILCVAYILNFSKGRGALIKLIGSLVFLSACATRGVFDFHGTPVVFMFALGSGLFLGEFFDAHPPKTPFKTAAVAVICVAMSSSFISGVLPNLLRMDYRQDVLSFQGDLSAIYIDAITEDGEEIGFSTLDCHVPVLSHTVPATLHGGSVPWFWEYEHDSVMQKLTSSPPRVFLYYEDLTVWGHSMRSYAPELVAFIESNYTKLGYGTSTVWVLNSYYEEAVSIINALD